MKSQKFLILGMLAVAVFNLFLYVTSALDLPMSIFWFLVEAAIVFTIYLFIRKI